LTIANVHCSRRVSFYNTDGTNSDREKILFSVRDPGNKPQTQPVTKDTQTRYIAD